MTTLIFRLRNVPDDEAQAVRELLDTHHIDWYETTAGNWGIAMPGLWIKNPDDVVKARSLIDEYQADRRNALRSVYEEGLLNGETRTFSSTLKQKPLRTIGILVFCLFILYVSINPFLQLIGYSSE